MEIFLVLVEFVVISHQGKHLVMYDMSIREPFDVRFLKETFLITPGNPQKGGSCLGIVM